jgi:hypothetical protein
MGCCSVGNSPDVFAELLMRCVLCKMGELGRAKPYPPSRDGMRGNPLPARNLKGEDCPFPTTSIDRVPTEIVLTILANGLTCQCLFAENLNLEKARFSFSLMLRDATTL